MLTVSQQSDKRNACVQTSSYSDDSRNHEQLSGLDKKITLKKSALKCYTNAVNAK